MSSYNHPVNPQSYELNNLYNDLPHKLHSYGQTLGCNLNLLPRTVVQINDLVKLWSQLNSSEHVPMLCHQYRREDIQISSVSCRGQTAAHQVLNRDLTSNSATIFIVSNLNNSTGKTCQHFDLQWIWVDVSREFNYLSRSVIEA